jgi:hypothetical protein
MSRLATVGCPTTLALGVASSARNRLDRVRRRDVGELPRRFFENLPGDGRGCRAQAPGASRTRNLLRGSRLGLAEWKVSNGAVAL